MRNLRPQVIFRIRIGIYATLFLWSSLLVSLSTLRLANTFGPQGDHSPTNEQPSYNISIAELWISGVLTIPFTLLIIFVLLSQKRLNTLSRNWFELTSLFILWCLWLGGAASSTTFWPNVGLCHSSPCSILAAILAFSWLGFTTLTFLLFPALYYATRYQAWDHHVFEQWTTPTVHDSERVAEQKGDSEAGHISSWTYQTQIDTRLSYRLSSFTDVLPWLVWSDHSTPFSSGEVSALPAHRSQRNSKMVHVTFNDISG